MSVPEYFPKRILSPTFTSRATLVPFSRILPLPTARTSPSWGFSLAESGMMMPPLAVSFSSMRRINRRSCSGRTFMAVRLLPIVMSASWLPLGGSRMSDLARPLRHADRHRHGSRFVLGVLDDLSHRTRGAVPRQEGRHQQRDEPQHAHRNELHQGDSTGNEDGPDHRHRGDPRESGFPSGRHVFHSSSSKAETRIRAALAAPVALRYGRSAETRCFGETLSR